MKPDVYIRADGNEQIGLGHLVRCSALAHMLKDDFNITFYSHSIPKQLENEFNGNGFKIVRIAEEKDFLSIVTNDKVVVLDGYGFDTNYQRDIKQKDAKLVCIDDLHDRKFFADLIINHAPGITPQDYKAQPYTQFALGLDYALLRPAFLKQAQKKRHIDKIETVLICFGGADPKGLTEKTLKIIAGFKKFEKIIVVTGTAFIKTREFDQLILSDNRVVHRHNLDEKQMLETMLEAQLSIIPSSSILLEALAVGGVVITGYYTNNQKDISNKFSNKYKQILVIGDLNTQSIKSQHIKNCENNILNWNIEPLITNNIQNNILKEFQNLNKEFSLLIRKATINDLVTYFNWANDKDVRNNAVNTQMIEYKDHVNWFNQKISAEDSFLFIFEKKNKPVGQVRFDKKNSSFFIDFSIDKKYRGKGFSRIILKKGIEKLVNEIDSKKNISLTALVKYGNIASVKTFEKMDFQYINSEFIKDTTYLIFQKNL